MIIDLKNYVKATEQYIYNNLLLPVYALHFHFHSVASIKEKKITVQHCTRIVNASFLLVHTPIVFDCPFSSFGHREMGDKLY